MVSNKERYNKTKVTRYCWYLYFIRMQQLTFVTQFGEYTCMNMLYDYHSGSNLPNVYSSAVLPAWVTI